MAATKEVMITVLNADGDMNYSRSVVQVSAGDTVNFKLGNATTQFKLNFNPSPFINGKQLFESGGADVPATIASVPPGRYYYTVQAFYTGPGVPAPGQWFNDPGCPEIVVK